MRVALRVGEDVVQNGSMTGEATMVIGDMVRTVGRHSPQATEFRLLALLNRTPRGVVGCTLSLQKRERPANLVKTHTAQGDLGVLFAVNDLCTVHSRRRSGRRIANLSLADSRAGACAHKSSGLNGGFDSGNNLTHQLVLFAAEKHAK